MELLSFHPYRLGEAYLNYAEALNESDPDNPDILTYLNLIRERAGIPQYGNGQGMIPAPGTQEEMRDIIRRDVVWSCVVKQKSVTMIFVAG